MYISLEMEHEICPFANTHVHLFFSRISMEMSLDQKLLVIRLENVLDPWIDAYIGSTFNIHVRVGLLKSVRDFTPHPQEHMGESDEPFVQDFSLALQSTALSSNLEPSRGDSPTSSPHVKFCACDIDGNCLHAPAAISHLNPFIKMCIFGPTNSKLRISTIQVTGRNFLLPNPLVLVEYHSVMKNRAFISGVVSDDYLDMYLRGLTLAGTTSIMYEDGIEVQAGFFVHYGVNTLWQQQPTRIASGSNIVKFSTGDDDAFDLQVCQCNLLNVCEERRLTNKSLIVKICILAPDSSIEQVVSMGLTLTSGRGQTVRDHFTSSSSTYSFDVSLT
jgi:hypothetical protein